MTIPLDDDVPATPPWLAGGQAAGPVVGGHEARAHVTDDVMGSFALGPRPLVGTAVWAMYGASEMAPAIGWDDPADALEWKRLPIQFLGYVQSGDEVKLPVQSRDDHRERIVDLRFELVSWMVGPDDLRGVELPPEALAPFLSWTVDAVRRMAIRVLGTLEPVPPAKSTASAVPTAEAENARTRGWGA